MIIKTITAFFKTIHNCQLSLGQRIKKHPKECFPMRSKHYLRSDCVNKDELFSNHHQILFIIYF